MKRDRFSAPRPPAPGDWEADRRIISGAREAIQSSWRLLAQFTDQKHPFPHADTEAKDDVVTAERPSDDKS